jgi:hypothetical protein
MAAWIGEGTDVVIINRSGTICSWVGTLLLLAGAAGGAEVQQDPNMSATVPALWKEQDIVFFYQSFTTFYSCDSLARKVERILLHLGADPDLKIRTTGCETGNTIARMPSLRIKVFAPVVVTPEVLAELDRNSSKRELIARVRGERRKGTEATEQFPAYWKRVSLSRGSLDLQPGDCDLIDQLKRKLLPLLAVRIVKDDTHCSTNQLSMGQPRLEVEALVKVPETKDVTSEKQ